MDVQSKVLENGRISTQLGLQRQSLASSLTQAAVLASAIKKLGRSQPSVLEGSVAVVEELAACRMQIAALVQENEALSSRLEQDSAAIAVQETGVGRQPLSAV